MSERVYRLLLLLYPRWFRRRYGAEMVEMYRQRGPGGGWRLALDALASGVAAHFLRAPHRVKETAHLAEGVRQDLRAAVRSLRRQPAFTALAVLTLALGAGAASAMFSLFNAVLLRPLPYQDAERLVLVATRTGTRADGYASYPEYADWRAQSKSFSAVAAWRGQSVNLTGRERPERLTGAFVSASFHPVVGARPQLGRTFLPEETEPGTAQPVAILGHAAWQSRFGGDPGVVGRRVTLNGQSFTIVGVIDARFVPGRAPGNGWFMATDVWLPAPYVPNARALERGQEQFVVIGRLGEGVTPAAAQADLDVVAGRLAAQYPETHAGRRVLVHPLQEWIVGASRPALTALLAAVLVVLLIACANVANLLLARGAGRAREMAVRAALGAGRARLFRQLLFEAAVLAMAAGVLGLAAANAAPLLAPLLPEGIGVPAELPLDGRVIAFALSITTLSLLVVGVVPALRVSATEPQRVLAASGGGSGRSRLRDVFVVAQGALSVVLLFGAALLLRSLTAIEHVPLGFEAQNLLVFQFRLPPAKYSTPERIARFFAEAEAQLSAMPGVRAVGLARAVPFDGNDGAQPYEVAGRPAPALADVAFSNIVSPGYFRAMPIPLLAGRVFERSDDAQRPRVAVVSSRFARAVFPGESALGRRLRLPDEDTWVEIVGVVGDTKHGSLVAEARSQIYLVHAQFPKIFTGVVVRTQGAPEGAVEAARAAIWSVDRDQPLWGISSMESLVDAARGPARALSRLTAMFAAVAALLAALGIYGLLSYVVAQRTREIGIRVALGATAGRVARETLRRSLALAAAASLLGIAGSLAAGRLLARLLYGVSPADGVSLAAAIALLMVTTFLASLLPARRAARVDPMRALAAQ